MVINSSKILEDINNKISNREIFKFNREFLVKSLIIASTKIQFTSLMNSNDINLINQLIEQFRTILKFIFSVDNEKGTIPNDTNQIILEFSKMILEFVDNYTPIRNYLDQCIIGTRKINFDNEKNVYYEDDYDSYSNYARVLDKVKSYPNENLKSRILDRMGDYLVKNKFKSNLFRDRYLYSLMNDYRDICWLDSEIKFDYDFSDFTYNELISFCAALKIIADYYSFLFLKDPCPTIDYKSLVYGISKLSNLSKDKVKLFLQYQTYDYDYQKDKLTLIQSLFLFNEKYYFYPITISLGMLPIKMYRLITDYSREKYKKDISIIAKNKEKQMTDEIVAKLKKYDLTIKLNYKMKKNNTDLAEYDMLAFDNKTNNLYICEFKWYFIGDGEKEHKRLDDKIEEAIKYRKKKDKFIFDNVDNISNELFNGTKINKIYEILISQNFSGSSKHDMTVIDFETLQLSTSKYESFEELMNYFLNDKFRTSLNIDVKIFDAEIEGYKFSFYRIIAK